VVPVTADIALKPITRDLIDAEVRIALEVPTAWAEAELPGLVLAASGALEERETLPPSLQIRADGNVTDAPVAAHVIPDLTDPAVVFTGERTHDGVIESVAEVEHRSDLSGTYQVSMLRFFYLPAHRLAVSVFASCGSGASQEVRDTLRHVVRSVRLGSTPVAPR
jgi:hypothetical protein